MDSDGVRLSQMDSDGFRWNEMDSDTLSWILSGWIECIDDYDSLLVTDGLKFLSRREM